jgi:aspartyl-tRNA(Asn)/glutamyl-tRNA(Gln) amidotransferase subunit A
MREIVDLSLCELAEAIRKRQVSAVEATKASLENIERWQPVTNAFIGIEAERALVDAQRADKAIAHGEDTGPLHGVPVAHKDIFYRAGMICTCGSKIRGDFRPTVTSTVIQRIEAAGAIQVGTLNLVEFAAGGTGHNDHFGNCLNPWNPSHSPGGSSSGAGAAVAARMIHAALGSDTGGSVRLPAMMCGIVGLKPSYGLISRYGVMPRSWTTDSVGPLTRTVRDCARITRVISGHDPKDPFTTSVSVPNYERYIEDDVRRLRLGVPTNYFYDNLSEEMRSGVQASLEVFRALGVELVEVEVPDLELAYTLAQVSLRAEASAIHEDWLRTRRQDYSVGVRSEVEAGLLIPAVRYLEAQRMRSSVLANLMTQTFNKVDVLHAPVLDRPAPRMDDVDPNEPTRSAEIMRTIARLTRPISYMGLCSLAVPCGFSNGLPIGFQLIGRPYAEARLFNLGHLYQRETDWHTHRPSL